MTPEDSIVVLTEEGTPENDEPITLRVVRAVAAASDRRVTDLEPLARHIDTDALKALFPSADAIGSGRTVEASFRYEGYLAEVDADRTVRLREVPDSPE